MTQPPARPKIYHITHAANLGAIVAEGALVSDREMLNRGGPTAVIGMSGIKQRRIEQVQVSCRPGTRVGDYVPFYFCPRSIRLYVIHCANHPELEYRGGQDPIIHLEADVHEVVKWAEANDRLWAFSLSNAGAFYAEFRAEIDKLVELNWTAIGSTDFRAAQIKEAKQAEFLLHGAFPFELVERIGVKSVTVQEQVRQALAPSPFSPSICLRPEWYY